MNHLFPYQIISAGLFVFGCFGLLRSRNHWAIIAFLQMMISGIILALGAIAGIGRTTQPASDLSIIISFSALTAMILLAVIFTLRVLRAETYSDDEST